MRYPIRLAGLTLGWLAGSAGGLLLTLLFVLSTLAPMESTEPHYRTYETLMWVMFVLVIAFFVLAPLGIAALARKWGRPRTAIVYAVLSALAAVATILQVVTEEF
ncbi:MAG TPA: hypothetical protein VN408_18675 [Actinoplanes sp.]|nr:hypothetical protein [Actinoplanes sp.]